MKALQDGTRKGHVDQVGVFERRLGKFDAADQQVDWEKVVRERKKFIPRLQSRVPSSPRLEEFDF